MRSVSHLFMNSGPVHEAECAVCILYLQFEIFTETRKILRKAEILVTFYSAINLCFILSSWILYYSFLYPPFCLFFFLSLLFLNFFLQFIFSLSIVLFFSFLLSSSFFFFLLLFSILLFLQFFSLFFYFIISLPS